MAVSFVPVFRQRGIARLALPALLVLSTGARPSAGDVRVSVSGAGLELRATAAPVSEVLERLAKQTGMKLVYDGPAPRQLVTVAVSGRSTADTVLAVLEGLGVNFALASAPSGTQTLLVMGSISPASSSSSPDPRSRADLLQRRPPIEPPPDEPFEDTQEEPSEDITTPPEAIPPPPGAPSPNGMVAPQPFMPPGNAPQPSVFPGPMQPQPFTFQAAPPVFGQPTQAPSSAPATQETTTVP